MPWAQFDDHFPDSEPALTAGVEACGLHFLATCWSAAHLTDGVVPSIIVKRLMSGCLDNQGAELVARLIAAELWEQRGGSYYLTDFLGSNRTRSKVLEDRERKAKAGRKGGRAKAAKDRQARSQSTSDVAVASVPDGPTFDNADSEAVDLPF